MQNLTGISGNILARMGKKLSMETVEKICKKLGYITKYVKGWWPNDI